MYWSGCVCALDATSLPLPSHFREVWVADGIVDDYNIAISYKKYYISFITSPNEYYSTHTTNFSREHFRCYLPVFLFLELRQQI